jgi:hypothetical protein
MSPSWRGLRCLFTAIPVYVWTMIMTPACASYKFSKGDKELFPKYCFHLEFLTKKKTQIDPTTRLKLCFFYRSIWVPSKRVSKMFIYLNKTCNQKTFCQKTVFSIGRVVFWLKLFLWALFTEIKYTFLKSECRFFDTPFAIFEEKVFIS